MDKKLIIKEIKLSDLPDYIQSAWENDADLPFFYDKSVKEKSLENMINDTKNKIEGLFELHEGVKIIGLKWENQIIGFVVFNDKLNYLYSFGINRGFRKKEILQEVFSYIKEKLKSFFCLLNKYNKRAIDWLKKCGMTEYPKLSPHKNIIYLKFDICQ